MSRIIVTKKLYENYHSKSHKQNKVIGEKNFTYINILSVLNSILNRYKNIENILDIGCGSGTISLYLASKGYNVKGVDISKKAIQACKQSAISTGLSNVFFETSEFPRRNISGKYDLVFFSEVLEHLPDDDAALEKIKALLDTNGILFISTPSINAPLHRLGLTKKFDKDVGHLRRYSAEELAKKLRDKEFIIKKTYKKESILRNFLFLNPIAGKTIRFIKYFLVDIVTSIDNVLVDILGESQIIIVAQKKSR